MATFLADFLVESCFPKQYQFTSRTWEYFLKSLQERLAIADSSVPKRDLTNSLTPELQLRPGKQLPPTRSTASPPPPSPLTTLRPDTLTIPDKLHLDLNFSQSTPSSWRASLPKAPYQMSTRLTSYL